MGSCPRTTWLTKFAILGLVLLGSAPGLVDPLARLLVPGLHAPGPADPWLAQGLACLAVILLLAVAVTIRWRLALGVWPTDVERLLGHPSPGHVVAVVRAHEQAELHELLWDGWRWRYLQPHGARLSRWQRR